MFIRLHDLILDICLGSETDWEFWRWKLDSFRVADDSATPDVYIDLTRDKRVSDIIDFSGLHLLHTEKNGFFSYSIYRSPDETLFFCMDRPVKKQRIISYSITSDWDKIKLIEDYSNTNGQLAFELLTRLLPSVFLKRSIIQLHGVLIEDSGKGIVICADSGVGKTTHARLWRDHRHSFIIDGDRASCVRDENGWTAYGIPWCGTSGEYMNRAVSIQALVVLERGETNEANRMLGLEPFFFIMPHLQFPVWDPKLRDKGMDLVQELVGSVPVFRLRCRPDTESVEVLEKAIRDC